MSDRAPQWHVTMRLKDDWTIARDVPQRRIAAGILCKFGREAGLFAFDVPDTHVHCGLTCDRETAGRFAHRAEVALHGQLRLEVGFERARIRPIRDQAHLRNCLRYILGNSPKHGVAVDPYREASNLPDAVGLRVLGSYTLDHIQSLLPRTQPSHLLAHLGIEALEEGTDVRLLAASAAAAAGLSDLRGRSAPVVKVRAAAAVVGTQLGMTTAWLGEHLAVTQRTIQSLLREAPDPDLLRAVRLQIGLRERADHAPEGDRG